MITFVEVADNKKERLQKSVIGDVGIYGERSATTFLGCNFDFCLDAANYVIPAVNPDSPQNFLSSFGIDGQTFCEFSMYDDPWSSNRFYSIVPMYIITPNICTYLGQIPQWLKSMIVDKEWQREWQGIATKEDLYGFCSPGIGRTSAFLGHGYTESWYPNDGSKHVVPAMMHLSNGDQLFCLTFKWCNK